MHSTPHRVPKPIHWLATLLIVSALGCAAQPASPPTPVTSATLNVPPQQLVEQVRRIVTSPPLSLEITHQQDGTIVTGWQPFRGEWHIARYWYERTRYHITVTPDFNDPTHRSQLEVTDETEQRAEEHGLNPSAQKWWPAPELHRPQRSEAVLRQIEERLLSPATTPSGS